jgi:hypothetical protein
MMICDPLASQNQEVVMAVTSGEFPQRRVAICTINDCCPFRTHLCQVAEGCHGSISGRRAATPEGFVMLTLDDEVVVRRDDALMVYLNAPDTAALFRDFDRGLGSEQLVGREYDFKAVPERHQPGRLKKALMAKQITLCDPS